MFVLYIDDLPSRVHSATRCHLFADDYVLYRELVHRRPGSAPGRFESSQAWASNWGMQFNPSKCHVLSINNLIDSTVLLLCYTSSTLNPWRNAEELVASPSCTKSYISMWQCRQPTWMLDLILADRLVRGTVTKQRLKILHCSMA